MPNETLTQKKLIEQIKKLTKIAKEFKDLGNKMLHDQNITVANFNTEFDELVKQKKNAVDILNNIQSTTLNNNQSTGDKAE